MNIAKMIAECRAELDAVDRAIATFEGLRSRPAGRRGRRSMGAEERREVSARMTRYWEGRRNAKQVGTPQ